MTEPVPAFKSARPEFRNINAFRDLPGYRWPIGSIVSGMHRVSGALMFLLLPFIIWMLDTSISSEISFSRFTALFNAGVAWNWSSFLFWSFAEPLVLNVPGWFFKVIAWVLIWAYLHHFIAGLRHIRMDIFHSTVEKHAAIRSARWVMVLSLSLTAVLGAKLFGLY
jgi:succinate dehydrogenase / fumarate reductase cytochrome b subunit